MNQRGVVASCCALAVAAFAVFLAVRPSPAPPRPQFRMAAAPAPPMVQILTGHVEAQHTVAVIVKPGRIDGFFADVGQSVTEGQVMARFETSATADSALGPAQAKLAALKSAGEEAKLEAARAKADAQRAREEAVRARKAFEREQKLMEVGATPRKVFEGAGRDAQAARLEAEKLEELSRQADNRIYANADEVREAAAAVEAAGKQDAEARGRLAQAEIHAPATGMVIERRETGPELFRIATDLNRLRAVFATAPGIRIGQEVLITFPGLEIAPVHSVISGVEGANATADFASPGAAVLPGGQCSGSVQLK